MTKAAEPPIDREEYARRGDAIYDRDVLARVAPQDYGKFVVIDIVSGDFEVGRDEGEASDRLLARRPAAQIWLRRIGSRYAYRFGGRRSPFRA